MPAQNAEIAAMFDQVAELLEIQGENPFRVRAYRRAARVVEGLPQGVAAMCAAGADLSELPGIGKDLAGKIADIVRTGRCKLLDALKRKLPGELGEMAALPGLGPKRIRLLHEGLGVRTFAELRRAVSAGRLRALAGFGPVIERRLAAALERPPTPKRFKLSVAEAEAESLASWLSEAARVVVAGSFRRRRETVGDLDILAVPRGGASAGERLIAYENVAEVLANGPTRTAVRLRSGLQVDVRVVPEESYGAALLYFTGSKSHNVALRGIANQRGWKLNEYGLFAGKRRVAGESEESVYDKLGLAFIAPEMREDRGEIALARTGQLPSLVTLADIKGDLHVHSDWTDGTASIAAMAARARQLGYSYLALTDHSRRVAVAHGLDARRLRRQIAEIERLNAKLRGITLLKGIEVDILEDGHLDLPDSVLAELDIVVAAVHSHFGLSRQAQTDRLRRAMANEHVSILAHPTGRLIGEREAYNLDFDRLIATARELGCILEINAQPERLDLDDVQARAARDTGVKLAVSSDAHSTESLALMHFGVDQARRGWLTASDVVNTRSLGDLRKLMRR